MAFDGLPLDLDESAPPPSGRIHRFTDDPAVFAIQETSERSERVASRHIESTPYKVLDAPGLVDDYYLNLLDWMDQSIIIALGPVVYSYNCSTKEVEELWNAGTDKYVSAVAGSHGRIFLGDSAGRMITYDMAKGVVQTVRQPGRARIGAVAVRDVNGLSLGDKTGQILNLDLRTGVIGRFSGHPGSEVCGLRWSGEYLASGGDDDVARIWKMGSPMGMELRGHGGAVRALDWCPWKRNVLATGGGSRDKSIRIWDTQSGACVKKADAGAQVCQLRYLAKYKELVSAHGFQENDLRVWRASGMRTISSFGKHDGRVLHLALSGDQCSLVSLGADESLKFWKMAERTAQPRKRDSIGLR